MGQANSNAMNYPSPNLGQAFGNSAISPGQVLLSVQKPDGSIVPSANGHYMIVQNLNNNPNSGKLQSRQAGPG